MLIRHPSHRSALQLTADAYVINFLHAVHILVCWYTVASWRLVHRMSNTAWLLLTVANCKGLFLLFTTRIVSLVLLDLVYFPLVLICTNGMNFLLTLHPLVWRPEAWYSMLLFAT